MLELWYANKILEKNIFSWKKINFLIENEIVKDNFATGGIRISTPPPVFDLLHSIIGMIGIRKF